VDEKAAVGSRLRRHRHEPVEEYAAGGAFPLNSNNLDLLADKSAR